ncbi:Uncharacterised protein [Ectopseudomonas mendocina]|uniref:Uncharacterized protein n=1 Tax=Ectopseudomonas mendocina TaxID=300 RepID=A0A379PN63_ECTME|nr:hypothetical protein [Pseudomonas mendocina]SUE95806.1 Uncharacterised protein [Pseudomonas mendocina]
MTVPAGWAEFNDANAVFRGRMVAASGTFSGTFSSDNVEAVREVNIRDGAVSAYYGFNFTAGAKTVEFTIPAQTFARVADVVVPLRIEAKGVGAVGYIHLYKNGTLYRTESVNINTEYKYIEKGADIVGYIPVMQVVRFIDFEVSANSPTTYKLVLQDSPLMSTNGSLDGEITLVFLGAVTVGCRKR